MKNRFQAFAFSTFNLYRYTAAAAEKEEERLRKELRKSTVFKAAPMPDYGEMAHMGVGAVKAPAVGLHKLNLVDPKL
jgi:hypothetical protein